MNLKIVSQYIGSGGAGLTHSDGVSTPETEDMVTIGELQYLRQGLVCPKFKVLRRAFKR